MIWLYLLVGISVATFIIKEIDRLASDYLRSQFRDKVSSELTAEYVIIDGVEFRVI